MVVDQPALGLADRLLDRVQLLRQVQAGTPFLEHLDHPAKVPLGTFQALHDIRVTFMEVFTAHLHPPPFAEVPLWPYGRELCAIPIDPPWGDTLYVGGMSHIRSNKSKLFARISSLRQNIEAMDAALKRDASSKELLQLTETVRREVGGFTAELIEDEIRPILVRRQASAATIKPAPGLRFLNFLRKHLR